MAKQTRSWKRSRGALGVMEPLIGAWQAEADSPMGRVTCRRTFSRILGDSAVALAAEWRFADGKRYEELAIYTAGARGVITFWSFTSDGKRSEGRLTDGADVHPDAIAFEAQVPAGTARMIYWPAEDGGVHWAVEARGKKGWRRFTEHHYHGAR